MDIGTPISIDGPSTEPASNLKWYKKPQIPHQPRSHPYRPKACVLQTEGTKANCVTAIEFWPFVRPYRFDREVEWDIWEDTFAVVCGDTIYVSKCTDERPYETLWELDIPTDTLDDVAWSYHPFTLHPILAVAGDLGLIYIIDAVTQDCIRVLKGHGGVIFCLRFAPATPHILASASADKTVRLWNIMGGDVEVPPEGEYLSENYGMARADEGSAAWCVLTGEGYGGHRDHVLGLAFHPNNRALATCGVDTTVKIWPLPSYPDAIPNEQPTPRGHRPIKILYPIFSTDKLHGSRVNAIEWLNDYVLVSQSRTDIIIWQWIGYERFFIPGKFGTVCADAQMTDFHRSHSFTMLFKYRVNSLHWSHRFTLHESFEAHHDDPPSTTGDNTRVFDSIIAFGVNRSTIIDDTTNENNSQRPTISLWNPSLAQEDPIPPPAPRLERRVDFESSDEEEYRRKAQKRRAKRKKQGEPSLPPVGISEGENNDAIPSNPSLVPWVLDTEAFWSGVTGQIADKKHKEGLSRSKAVIRAVGVSPRGGEWIVGVREGETVVVFQRSKEGEGEEGG